MVYFFSLARLGTQMTLSIAFHIPASREYVVRWLQLSLYGGMKRSASLEQVLRVCDFSPSMAL
jgi:hypothetical protein